MSSSLWGFKPTEQPLTTPVHTLKEQVAEFNQTWKDTSLYAEVNQLEGSGTKLAYSLRIIAPLLNEYRLTVLTIKYEILGYPVEISSDFGGGIYRQDAYDEGQYRALLQRVLSDEKLHSAVSSLAAHSSST